MIELRNYQQGGVDDIRNFFKKGKHAILQAPTGAGKTIIFSYIAQNAALLNKKVLIMTDRAELLTQTGGALEGFGVDPFLIRAGTKFLNFDAKVYVAMCQTLRNRVKHKMWQNWIKKNIDLVIIDEAHKQDFNYLFESGLMDGKFVLGFTATPQRTGKMRQLALDYDVIIPTTTVKNLIDLGFLVGDDFFGVNGVDLNNIKIDPLKGDFDERAMFERFNAPKIYSGVVKNWMELSPNTKTIVFCVNIEHCIHTVEEFQKNGIDARFVVSKMMQPSEPDKTAQDGAWTQYTEKMRLFELYNKTHAQWSGDRTTMIKKFKNNDFPVLVNAGILTTGFDCPDIETVIVNRATTSITLWLQMIGRGSRIHKGKTHFNLLDFGGNAGRLGHYTAPQHFGLWHASAKEGGGVAPVKECGSTGVKDKNGKKGCERLIMASTKICPFCGYIYPVDAPKDVELIGVAYDGQKHEAIAVKKINDMSNDELFTYYQIKKHKPAWLWRQLYFRGGFDLIDNFGKQKGWQQGTISKAKQYVSDL